MRNRLVWIVLPAAAFLLTVAGIGLAQQKVPFQNGIPVAPKGLKPHPLPDKPMVYDTAEGMDIKVVVLTKDLEYPWAMAFLPDGTALITERPGRLRILRNGVLDPNPVAGAPKAFWSGDSGLPGTVHGYMDVARHPKFSENHYIYLTYSKPVDEKRHIMAVARGRFDGRSLTDVQDVYTTNQPGTSRIAFARDGTLFITTTGNNPQDANTLGGKILRINDDGSIPKDNPFVGQADHKPEVYALGIRSALGLAVHPGTGEMWETENGPNGGDEINILKPGRNYGWPVVSYGRTYPGPWQSTPPGHLGFEPPTVYWTPAIAVSGLAFYTGDKLPKWKGDVFVGSLREGEIPGTGHLERILFNEKMEELRREALLRDLRQRIREVRQGQDGYLYLLTDEKPGAVLRIEPAQ